MKTNKTNRIFQLLTILQSQRHYEISELAEILGISQRTFFRELKDIRDAGISCNFDPIKHYYAFDSKTPLPMLALTKEEAFCVLLLLYKARLNSQLPFSVAALTAAIKIENGLSRKVNKFCHTSLQAISVSRAPQTRIDSLDDIFSQLLDATQKRQVMNIHYYLPCEQKIVIADFNPYHLIYAEYTWHIVGKSSIHKAIHTLKLNQIKQLNPLDKYFEEDEQFNLREYFGHAWSLLREGQIYDVELKFSPGIAADVAEVQWHETQTVSFEDNGSAILKFRVDGLNEITWWILSYGDMVKVLAPRALKQRIIQIAQRIANSSKSAPAG